MRIVAYCNSFWNTADEAKAKMTGPLGLFNWELHVEHLLSPVRKFIACGTWSEPDHCLPFTVINSGADCTRPYNCWWWQYAACAFTAGMAHAVTKRDWDLLFFLDTDTLVGAVDLKAILTEFLDRPELLLAPQWMGRPDLGFSAMKREAASMWLHERWRPNLIRDQWPNGELPMLLEDEWKAIYGAVWWNPWPELGSIRQGYGVDQNCQSRNAEVMGWPLVERPHPDVIELYLKTQTSKAVPV